MLLPPVLDESPLPLTARQARKLVVHEFSPTVFDAFPLPLNAQQPNIPSAPHAPEPAVFDASPCRLIARQEMRPSAPQPAPEVVFEAFPAPLIAMQFTPSSHACGVAPPVATLDAFPVPLIAMQLTPRHPDWLVVSVVVVASPLPLIAQHGSTSDWQFDDVASPLPLIAMPPSLVAFPSPLTART
jgi:hypothetical protein